MPVAVPAVPTTGSVRGDGRVTPTAVQYVITAAVTAGRAVAVYASGSSVPHSGRMPGNFASLLVIFGASGDLAQRMLLPSLYGLQHAGLLTPELRILGTARSEMDDAAFRADVADAVRRNVPEADLYEASLEALSERVG